MPTAKKAETIAELRERISASPNLFFTNFAGLTVEETGRLRNELRKDGNTYSVVKNTLFSIAAGEELAARIESHLAGPTAVVFSGGDPAAAAKALKTFADETKKLQIKAAIVEGQVVDAAGVNALASLPPRSELIAKLVGTLAAPIRGLLTVLQGNQSGLVRVLEAGREQKAAAEGS